MKTLRARLWLQLGLTFGILALAVGGGYAAVYGLERAFGEFQFAFVPGVLVTLALAFVLAVRLALVFKATNLRARARRRGGKFFRYWVPLALSDLVVAAIALRLLFWIPLKIHSAGDLMQPWALVLLVAGASLVFWVTHAIRQVNGADARYALTRKAGR